MKELQIASIFWENPNNHETLTKLTSIALNHSLLYRANKQRERERESHFSFTHTKRSLSSSLNCLFFNSYINLFLNFVGFIFSLIRLRSKFFLFLFLLAFSKFPHFLGCFHFFSLLPNFFLFNFPSIQTSYQPKYLLQ